MPRIIFTVSEDQKERWTVSADGERIKVAEWIRRACEARASIGVDRLVHFSADDRARAVAAASSDVLPVMTAERGGIKFRGPDLKPSARKP